MRYYVCHVATKTFVTRYETATRDRANALDFGTRANAQLWIDLNANQRRDLAVRRRITAPQLDDAVKVTLWVSVLALTSIAFFMNRANRLTTLSARGQRAWPMGTLEARALQIFILEAVGLVAAPNHRVDVYHHRDTVPYRMAR
jgi:hypothetical protein